VEFENTFGVEAPADEVFATLLDVSRVAPCMPGAEVLEDKGDGRYQVSIKVKLGPIRMQYRGDVEVVESDAAGRSATLVARARETRGQGSAEARVRMELTEDGSLTRAKILSQVQLTGRTATMGQSAIRDVSRALIDDFARNLATMLGRPAEPVGVEAAGPSAAEATPSRKDDPTAPRDTTSKPVLPAGRVVDAVVRGRLQDPRWVAAGVAGALVVGYAAGRRRG
jgi:carbon monoxide dehydrogenase subunit G